MALGALLLAAMASAPAAGRAAHASEQPRDATPQPSAVRPAAAERSGTDEAGSAQEASPGVPVFEFHGGFWINLHHFLYQQARQRKGTGTRSGQGEAPGRAPGAAQVSTEGLTPAERQGWTAALDYYGGDLADRDLLFNGDMVLIKNRLAGLEACAELSGEKSRECASGLRPGLIAALEGAAAVYRARWWPEHDRVNRSWVASAGPLVRRFGAGLAQQLAATYRADWPAGRLRVDVVIYGGPFGAYTTLDPVYLTISSSDLRNQGSATLEVLFHEASHTLAGAVRDTIVRECRARGKPIPRDLWHALLFYTTGEMVKRALSAAEGSAGGSAGNYTPYAYRYGLYARGWSHYQRGLERYWQPYLDGKAEFDTALARLVANL